MITKIGTFQGVLEETPPFLAKHPRRVVQGVLCASVTQGSQQGLQSGREGYGESASPAALGRGKSDRLTFEVNVTQGNLSFRLPASGVDRNFKANLHPALAVFQCGADVDYFLIGQLRLFLGFFLGYAEAVTRIILGIFKPDSLTHDNAEDLNVIQCGVELDRTTSTLPVLGAPFQISQSVLIGQFAWNMNAAFAEIHAQPTPRQSVPFKCPWHSTVTFQERENPIFPTLDLAVDGRLMLAGCEFSFQGAGLPRFGGIIAAKLGALEIALAGFGIDEFDVPVLGILPFNKGGHSPRVHHMHQNARNEISFHSKP